MSFTHPFPLLLLADKLAAWLRRANNVACASEAAFAGAVAGGDFVGGVITDVAAGAFVRGSLVAVGDLFVSIIEQIIFDSVSFLSKVRFL